MTDPIERYCKAHKIAVAIHRQDGEHVAGEKVVLLVCEHTFAPNTFKCNLLCVYAQDVQIAVELGRGMAQMMGTDMAQLPLNSDGTIPLDYVLKESEVFVDYTSKMPIRATPQAKKWWQFWKKESEEESADFSRYTNTEWNFSLSHPKDWQIIGENYIQDVPWVKPVQIMGPKRLREHPYFTVVAAIVEDSGEGLAGYMLKAESGMCQGL